MADLPPGRVRGDAAGEPDPELGRDAYEASVPTQLGGFRGTNPTLFVIGGAIAFGIILLAFFAFIHRGSTAPSRVATTGTGEAVPVGPGVGAGLQTPFIPEATLAPGPKLTLAPIVPIPTLAPTPLLTAVPVVVQQQPAPVVPAPAESAGTDQMAIAQPSGAPAAAGSVADGAAATQGKTKYVPVFRNGKLVSVVPVPDTGATAEPRAGAPAGAQVPNDVTAPNSAQFVSNGSSTGGGTQLGSGNSGLVEARKYSGEASKGNVGYTPTQSRRQLDAATVINARLLTKVESDLPGSVIAQVIQPVYDSATHTIVVIPSGSKLFGTYDEETVATSARLLMAFQRVIFPDGQEFDMGGLEGSSANGTAGFDGDVDRHRGALYTSAILLSVLAGAESAVSPQQNGILGTQSVTSQVQSAAGAELAQTGNKIINQAVDRPATIIVRPPYVFQVIVTHDLPLDEYVAQHQ